MNLKIAPVVFLLFLIVSDVAIAEFKEKKIQPTSFFTVSDTVCANEPVIVNYTGNADISADFYWDFDGAAIIAGSGQGPYTIKWNSGGHKEISLYVAEGAQISDTTQQSVYVDKIYSGLLPVGPPVVCSGDSATLLAFINNGCSYQWMYNGNTIPGEVKNSCFAGQTGHYAVLTSNINTGCSVTSDSVQITIGEKDFPLDFSANPQFMTSPVYAVAFNNLTPAAFKYNFTWNFGDGNDSICDNSPVFYIYKYSGLYNVSLIAEDKVTGCRDTLTRPDYVYCINGPANPCNLNVTISCSVPGISCPGRYIPLMAYCPGADWYQWYLNGQILAEDTNAVCYANGEGYYEVTAGKNFCSGTSAPYLIERYPVVTPVVFYEGGASSCFNDTIQLYTPELANIVSVIWSDSIFGHHDYITESGYYSVTVTDTNGCQSTSDPLGVNVSKAAPPEICIALVDSIAKKNKIVWDTPPDIAIIDSFKVYKEISTGYYLPVATLPKGIREFIDYNSVPDIHPDSYRLSAIDTFNVESLPGNYHKTCFVKVIPGIPFGYTLSWQHYEGFTFGKYYIYKGTNAGFLQVVDSVNYSPSVNTYTDTMISAVPKYYMITAIKQGGPCIGSGAKDMSGPYSQSLSNIIDNSAFISSSLIEQKDAGKNSMQYVRIFPNPAYDFAYIEFKETPAKIYDFELADLQGRLLVEMKIKDKLSQLTLGNIRHGLYFAKISNAEYMEIIKLIVK